MIYKYKTEGRIPKDFRNYQNLIDLFRNLRDSNINPKEVLKFRSDLGEIKKKRNPDLKSKDQISVIQNGFFLFKIKYYWLLRLSKRSQNINF